MTRQELEDQLFDWFMQGFGDGQEKDYFEGGFPEWMKSWKGTANLTDEEIVKILQTNEV